MSFPYENVTAKSEAILDLNVFFVIVLCADEGLEAMTDWLTLISSTLFNIPIFYDG